MTIQAVNYQIAWRFDDENGDAIWNRVENLPPGVALPPLPAPGERIELAIEGVTFFARVTRASLSYQIDGVINITCRSNIQAI